MANFIEAAEKAALAIKESECLSGYAADEALIVLISNWRHAINDGSTPKELLGDIDDTITHLQNFKRALEG